jgi:hypothetical protein
VAPPVLAPAPDRRCPRCAPSAVTTTANRGSRGSSPSLVDFEIDGTQVMTGVAMNRCPASRYWFGTRPPSRTLRRSEPRNVEADRGEREREGARGPTPGSERGNGRATASAPTSGAERCRAARIAGCLCCNGGAERLVGKGDRETVKLGGRWGPDGSPPPFGRVKGLDEHPAASSVYPVRAKSL